jgi:hypothetical protein
MTGASLQFLVHFAWLSVRGRTAVDKLNAIRRRRQNMGHFGTCPTTGPEGQT